MTRLLTLRALCERCEAAEATVWCVVEHTTLCAACDSATHAHPVAAAHRRVPIAARSAVAALCARCRIAPAALADSRAGAPLCELCVGAAARAAANAAANAVAAGVAGGGDCVHNAPSNCHVNASPGIGVDVGLGGGVASAFDLPGVSVAVPGASGGNGVVLLEDAKFAGSIMFDRMDFSCVGGCEDGEDEEDVVMNRDARFVDLSYFRSSVPTVPFRGRTSPT